MILKLSFLSTQVGPL
uniref:Uncharacterized protein n=1 Tax=Lepeophtheirus salmonis TaxID=72036 RepID=A0A0K2UZW2_LEPSM